MWSMQSCIFGETSFDFVMLISYLHILKYSPRARSTSDQLRPISNMQCVSGAGELLPFATIIIRRLVCFVCVVGAEKVVKGPCNLEYHNQIQRRKHNTDCGAGDHFGAHFLPCNPLGRSTFAICLR